MEALPEIAKDIISQADKWTFEGDCMILKWMEQISQNLENRAKTTAESLDKLQANFNRAQIALENTQNNLTALQYTQYVEMRCQDDELPLEPETESQPQIQKSSDDVLKTFLQNNLKMLHNCHEKFNFLEDSDEEDTATAIENCVYQPRNPYNERLLPHIFGTKMWKENWHVGLCDDSAMDYSGDELSEIYSISSASSSVNGSLESHNTASLSQWTSTASLNNENFQKSINTAQQPTLVTATSIQASGVILPELKQVSNESHFLTTKDLNSQDNARNEATSNVEVSSEIKQPELSGFSKKKPLQCKTLNLFDDNDFNSLMSEIVDKANTKNDRSTDSTSKVISANPMRKDVNIDLFGNENINDIPTIKVVPPISKTKIGKKISTSAKPENIATEKAEEKIKSVNLFDSLTQDSSTLENPSNGNSEINFFKDLDEDTGGSNKPTISSSTTTSRYGVRTKLSTKSLFDDDDGDEDFLSLFGKGKQNTKSAEKTRIISEDFDVKKSTKTMLDDSALLSENKENEKEKEENIETTVKVMDNDENKEAKKESSKKKTTNQISKPLFFEDDFEDDLFSKKPALQREGANKSLTVYVTTKPPEDTEQKLNDDEEINAPGDNNDSDDEWFNSLSKSKSLSKAKNYTNIAFENSGKVFQNSEPPLSISSTSTEENISAKANNTSVDPYFIEKTTAEVVSVSTRTTSLHRAEPPNSVADFVIVSKPIYYSTPLADEVNEIKILETEKNSHQTLKGKTEEISTSIIIPEKLNEKASLNKIMKIETETIKASNEKPADSAPVFNNYSALFPDEPPDDDFFQTIDSISHTNTENDYFKPSAFNKNIDESNRSSVGYNIGLFNDFPPEDEGDNEDHEKTASTNSSPTTTNTLSDTKSSSQIKPTSFINELPPPDDNYEKENMKTNSNDFRDEADHKARIIESPVEFSDNTKIVKPTTVSKLKMPKININVQALLPNADGKNIQSNTETGNRNGNETHLSTNAKLPPIASVSNEATVEHQRPDLLSNLCKNRVRIPVKRKSSTRAARKESYQKTLMLAQEEERQINTKTTGHEKNKIAVPVEIFIPKKNETEIQKKTSASINQSVSKFAKQTSLSIVKEAKNEKIKTSINSKILNESDDNSDDDFFSKLAKPKTIASAPAITVASQSDDSDNDLFRNDGVAGSKSASQPNQMLNKTQSVPKPTIEPSKLNSLFVNNSNEENDDNDDFLSSLSKPKTTFPSPSTAKATDFPKSTSAKSKNNNKCLFSDSEDDDDDLFGNISTKPKSAFLTSSAATSKGATKKLLQSKPTQVKTAISKSTDNPLADLLDP